MDKQIIIQQTCEFVKNELAEAEAGHDWSHIERVWKNAKKIAAKENVDLFTVELAALLHDIADSKFHDGNENIGPEKAIAFLSSLNVDSEVIEHVEQIIRNISFKGGNFERDFDSLELQVVQDADRLDAMGAIGIARTFHYGGYKNREIYNAEIPPQLNLTKEEYKASTSPTINHFYEKLLLLSDKMNTETGKKIAKKRHDFMVHFLAQFYAEWEGKV
jgi:uncharacterized protein